LGGVGGGGASRKSHCIVDYISKMSAVDQNEL
jgi:hypothetical protein